MIVKMLDVNHEKDVLGSILYAEGKLKRAHTFLISGTIYQPNFL